MTQISLSKVLALIDEERGEALKCRKTTTKGASNYEYYSAQLRVLNRLKKEIAHLSDADQLPLGL